MPNRKTIFNLHTNKLRTNRCKIQRPYGKRPCYNSIGAPKKKKEKKRKKRKDIWVPFKPHLMLKNNLAGWMSHDFPQNNNLSLLWIFFLPQVFPFLGPVYAIWCLDLIEYLPQLTSMRWGAPNSSNYLRIKEIGSFLKIPLPLVRKSKPYITNPRG